MSKERYNQIIDDVYKNYKSLTHNKNEKNGNYGDYSKWVDNPLISGVQHLTKDSFIQLIKIDADFSQRWGLKIEERELSQEERLEIGIEKLNVVEEIDESDLRKYIEDSVFNMTRLLNDKSIPTKVITTKYQNETVITYE
jgi:hypothetical protein